MKMFKYLTGTTVKGFKSANGSTAITAVETDKGTIKCDQVIVGVGPWLRDIWNMLELPTKISIKDRKWNNSKRLSTYVALLVPNRRSIKT